MRLKRLGVAAVAAAIALAGSCSTAPSVGTPAPPTGGTPASASSASGAMSTSPGAECPAAASQWQAINTLAGYLAHDGVARSRCEILVAADVVSPRGAALLVSSDGGVTFQARLLPGAVRVRRLFIDERWLDALGEDASGAQQLYRSSDDGLTWVTVAVPLAQAFDAARATPGVVVVGRTDQGASAVLFDGSGWSRADSLPASAQLRVVTGVGEFVAIGGVDGDRGVVYTSADGGRTFHEANLRAEMNSITGLAWDGARLIIGGFRGPRVESATAVSLGLDRVSGTQIDLSVPSGVQLIAPTCAGSCYAIVPTGHSDVIVQLPAKATDWRITTSGAGEPLVLERLALGDGVMYALGPGTPLLRAGR